MTDAHEKSGHGRTLRDDLSEAGHDMWLAGLGAMAFLEKEGRNAFERLVEKGKAVETQERTRLDHALDDAAGQVRAFGRRLEGGLQDTSRTVLQRFGIPSHAEIDALITRVEQLTAKVEAISRKEGADDKEV